MISNIGIYPNFAKQNSINLSKKVIEWLLERNIKVFLTEDKAMTLDLPELGLNWIDFIKQSDIIVILGGDGTLLKVARKVAPNEIPLLGVNLGNLGFLTEVEVPELFNALIRVLNDDFVIEKRMMLEATVLKDDIEFQNFIALNDVVVTKGPFARLVHLKVYVNDEYIETYPADGLIVSSPTGSTAYSLSAGGPIINPNVNLLLITPICPHTLHSRSIIISEDEKIRIVIKSDHRDIMLTMDGQQGFKLQPNDEVIIKKANYYTKLIRLKQRSFYEVLRKKISKRDSD